MIKGNRQKALAYPCNNALKRLIDANALMEQFDDSFKGFVMKRIVEMQPTVDAVPVVHGRWIRYEHGSGIFCSHCRHKRRYRDAHDNYCPNCGAKMDGGNEDG